MNHRHTASPLEVGEPERFWRTAATRRRVIVAVLLGSCVFFAGAIRAEGFRNPPAGTFGLGRAGGRVAHVDDASAVTHNPANLARLTELEVLFDPTFVAISAEHTALNGAYAKTRDPWKLLPAFYAAYPLPEKRLALGFGVNAPFGLSILYNPNTSFRYLAPYHNDLKVINLNPSLAYKLHEKLTLGAGVDVFLSELKLKQTYPWLVFPGGLLTDPDGELSVRGKGVGVGGNLGVTWDLSENHRLAFTVRSPVRIDYDGDFRVANLSAAGAAAGATPRSDFSSNIRFPTVLGVGYGVRLSPKIRLEADLEWVEFSSFKSLPIGAQNNAILLPSSEIPQNWHDTFTAGVAGDWEFAPGWKLMAGYQFYESPVPDQTLSPSIPDANQNVLTVGLSWRGKRHALGMAYGAVFYDTRDISNNLQPAYNGRWEMMVHIFSCAYSCRF